MAEPQWRLGAFIGALLVLIALERCFPKRPKAPETRLRWISNLGLSVLVSLTLRFLLPVSTVAWALIVEKNNWSPIALYRLSHVISYTASFLLLDCLIYLQHRVYHAVPLLWRVHKVHHADTDLDVTSGVRFHPVEALLSALMRMAATWLVGIPAAALLLFEIVLNVSALFNHSNLAIPAAWDAALRRLIVTPDMHRVHHSVIREETDSNFGFFLSWWDRLFRSYRPAPREGQMGMTIGLQEYHAPLPLLGLLKLPFLP